MRATCNDKEGRAREMWCPAGWLALGIGQAGPFATISMQLSPRTMHAAHTAYNHRAAPQSLAAPGVPVLAALGRMTPLPCSLYRLPSISSSHTRTYTQSHLDEHLAEQRVVFRARGGGGGSRRRGLGGLCLGLLGGGRGLGSWGGVGAGESWLQGSRWGRVRWAMVPTAVWGGQGVGVCPSLTPTRPSHAEPRPLLPTDTVLQSWHGT